jgi:competence protein ComEC
VKRQSGRVRRGQHTTSYAVPGTPEMANLQKTPYFELPARTSVAFIGILITLIFSAGCLNTAVFTVFFNNQTHLADNEGNLSVFFLDVGEGDSTLFVVEGKTVLIDAGEIDRGDQVVSDLRRLGVRRIDLLVATHPHSDHIGGMQKVLAAFPVGQVLDTGLPHPSPLYEHFLQTVDEKKIPYRIAERGQTIEVDHTLRVFVLSPPGQRYGDDLNTNSVVLRISYGMVDFLMTGDVGGEGENALLTSGYPLDAEILKVAHHGSSSSTFPEFLARVHPEMAIISLSEDNPYGYPHTETQNILHKNGVVIYRTDLNGTVVVRTDGMSYSVKTEKNNRGIWTVPAMNGTAGPFPVFTIPSFPTLDPVVFPSFTLPPPPTNLTFPQIGNSSGVYISETQFNAPGDDRQNLNGEWVRLTNRGDDIVLISGWTLSDRSNKTFYTFPAIFLAPGEMITVYSGTGALNKSAVFMNKNEPVWGNSGDIAVLKDGKGILIDQKSEGGK